MLYQSYELARNAAAPLRLAAQIGAQNLGSPMNPFRQFFGMRTGAAFFNAFSEASRIYAKPKFGIHSVNIEGVPVPIQIRAVREMPFCKLLHFRRLSSAIEKRQDRKLLLVAPLSGHFATLLRHTAQVMAADFDLYVTDWADAREVPLSQGHFNLEDYIDYIIADLEWLARDGRRPLVVAVCQPVVPVFAACALMAQEKNPARPEGAALIGGPIDTRINPTEPNRVAESRSLAWFENRLIHRVPWPNKGFMRKVYPGFLQLSGFIAMNMGRHINAHSRYFANLVRGDEDSVAMHRKFYDEYLAVMDLTAEYYLQTVSRVFQRHDLPEGRFYHHDRLVEPAAIEDIALMTLEGGRDDITGRGQTEAALSLCKNLPKARQLHYFHPEVGHYGLFNGKRWQNDIYPELKKFLQMAARREASG